MLDLPAYVTIRVSSRFHAFTHPQRILLLFQSFVVCIHQSLFHRVHIVRNAHPNNLHIHTDLYTTALSHILFFTPV